MRAGRGTHRVDRRAWWRPSVPPRIGAALVLAVLLHLVLALDFGVQELQHREQLEDELHGSEILVPTAFRSTKARGLIRSFREV